MFYYIYLDFHLSDEVMEIVCESMKYLQPLSKLYLVDNDLSKNCFEKLCYTVPNICEITELSFYRNNLGDESISTFSHYMKFLPNLRNLGLGSIYIHYLYLYFYLDNNISNAGIKDLSNNLSYVSNLQELYLFSI